MSWPLTPETAEAARAAFEEDGFFFTPSIIPKDELAAGLDHFERIVRGEYETGVEPFRVWQPPTLNPRGLIKIDNTHESDRTILELLSHSAIGAWAAAITGAKRLQVFATQLLYKASETDESGNVGWHRDCDYWHPWWTQDTEGLTAWLSLDQVTSAHGPMRYVRGSHRWGQVDGGDFWSTDLMAVKDVMHRNRQDTWEEVEALLPPGAVSFHHKATIHGSGPNLSNGPRRSFVIHLRTENSEVIAGATHHYVANLDDPLICPVIHG